MATKLTVIFYIILCLVYGSVLVLLPWGAPLLGLAEWGDNYFLLYAAQAVGSQGLQTTVASGWVRGAVTGLGLLNIGMALWEIAHFRRTVHALDEDARREAGARPARTSSLTSLPPPQDFARNAILPDATRHRTTSDIPDNERSAHS